ncbi:hypothetical protein XA68_10537 [Ophiocordyceps unilateralis]|uniref:Uncharacterized protein n=1 Tax=Ophiocordyceps unilateralis TaxID=268505 RepID=A0A2A9P2I9_OPHUN|nr:hypothetical protein XA68_10537 [Ophiocordyceps unilateralis]
MIFGSVLSLIVGLAAANPVQTTKEHGQPLFRRGGGGFGVGAIGRASGRLGGLGRSGGYNRGISSGRTSGAGILGRPTILGGRSRVRDASVRSYRVGWGGKPSPAGSPTSTSSLVGSSRRIFPQRVVEAASANFGSSGTPTAVAATLHTAQGITAFFLILAGAPAVIGILYRDIEKYLAQVKSLEISSEGVRFDFDGVSKLQTTDTWSESDSGDSKLTNGKLKEYGSQAEGNLSKSEKDDPTPDEAKFAESNPQTTGSSSSGLNNNSTQLQDVEPQAKGEETKSDSVDSKPDNDELEECESIESDEDDTEHDSDDAEECESEEDEGKLTEAGQGQDEKTEPGTKLDDGDLKESDTADMLGYDEAKLRDYAVKSGIIGAEKGGSMSIDDVATALLQNFTRQYGIDTLNCFLLEAYDNGAFDRSLTEPTEGLSLNQDFPERPILDISSLDCPQCRKLNSKMAEMNICQPDAAFDLVDVLLPARGFDPCALPHSACDPSERPMLPFVFTTRTADKKGDSPLSVVRKLHGQGREHSRKVVETEGAYVGRSPCRFRVEGGAAASLMRPECTEVAYTGLFDCSAQRVVVGYDRFLALSASRSRADTRP